MEISVAHESFSYLQNDYEVIVWENSAAKPAYKDKAPLLLLHGFAQSAQSWDKVAQSLALSRPVVALSFLGHGKSTRSNLAQDYTFSCILDLLEVFVHNFCTNHFNCDKIHFLGYSMGGRIATLFAAFYPDFVASLTLESSSLGATSQEWVDEMTARDENLIHRLETSTIEEFIEFWEELPLFQTQKLLSNEARQSVKNGRLKNDTQSLAYTVAGSGQAQMPNLIPVINDIVGKNIPVMYMAGVHDLKYKALAETIACKAPVEVQLATAGHNIHLENPTEYITLVKEFIG